MSTEVIEEAAKPIAEPPTAEPAEPAHRYGFMLSGCPIDVEPGWKLLPEGEEIVRGDEYLHIIHPRGVKWEECGSTVGKHAGLHPEGHGPNFVAFRRKLTPESEAAKKPTVRYGYRRNDPTKPINPGRGWRLLKIGETVERGDQFTRDDTTERLSWKGVRYGGATVCETSVQLAFRRRIAKPSPAVTEPAKPEPSKPLYGTIDFNNREAEKAEIRVLNELLDEYPRYYIQEASQQLIGSQRWVARIESPVTGDKDYDRFLYTLENLDKPTEGQAIITCGWAYPSDMWSNPVQITRTEARAWLGRDDI